ncbi:MAG: YkvA family protein [Myxococcota bacterium]
MSDRVEIDLRAREKRIYDRLRARIATVEPGARPGVRDLLLFLPDLIVLLLRLAQDPRVPAGSKAVALFGVGYALSPIDLIPELFFGPLGFVDDLLVVAAAVSRIVNHVHPDLVNSHWPGHGDVLDVVQRVTSWSETMIGKTVTRLLGFKQL